MSQPQFDSLKAEVLYLLGRANAPLTVAELYERSELAVDIAKVSKATYNLVADKSIVRVDGEGRARYMLAAETKAPAPAGKGRGPSQHKPPVAPREQAPEKATATTGEDAAPAQPETTAAHPAPHIPTLSEQLNAMAEKVDLEKIATAFPAPPESTQAKAGAGLADAIIARLKRDLGPLLRPPVVGDLDVTTAPGAIHITVQSVEINISIGVDA